MKLGRELERFVKTDQYQVSTMVTDVPESSGGESKIIVKSGRRFRFRRKTREEKDHTKV